MVALAGAGPWPQITSTVPLRTSLRMTGTSPPGPLRWGSTTCSVKAVATAASKALPPFSSVAMPTAVAIQWVDVTTPKVPSISGRVVNGLGFILDIRGGQRQDFQPARRLFALGQSLAKRVYWKCHPRPRLFGIDRRVLAERADRSLPPNGGVTLRSATQWGGAKWRRFIALNKSLGGPWPSSQLPETMLHKLE